MDLFGKSITQRQKKGVYSNLHFTTETTLLAGIARKLNKVLGIHYNDPGIWQATTVVQGHITKLVV